MKIFANNFALALQTHEHHPHFRFARTPLELVEARLLQEPEFPVTNLFTDASPENGFLEAVKEIHTRPDIAARHATWNLVFENEAALELFRDQYTALFHPVSAAGGLVLRGDGSLLMMVRDGKIDLPKGKVEKKEAVETAAWREVEEETGLKGHVLGELADKTYHIYLRKGRWDFKTTHWYWMTSTGNQNLVPQTEEGITELRWVKLDELGRSIPETYPQIMELARLAAFRGPEILAQ